MADLHLQQKGQAVARHPRPFAACHELLDTCKLPSEATHQVLPGLLAYLPGTRDSAILDQILSTCPAD